MGIRPPPAPPVEALPPTPAKPESRIGHGRPSGISRLSLAAPKRIASASREQAVAEPVPATSTLLPDVNRPAVVQPPKARPHSNGTTLPRTPNGRDTSAIRLAIQDIPSAIPSESVDALKVVQRLLDQAPSDLLLVVDDIVDAITMQMRVAFSDLAANTPAAILRLCKHLMQTLSAFFDNATLGRAVSQTALVGLLAELTRRLLETADDTSSEAILSLSKVRCLILSCVCHCAD